ncbi:MAG: DUF4850 domain-containing protein [Proteobacteria bacterium]|nr:DUF4850 domain-containing protein [Pseudomonadota bacterium]
MSNHFIRGWVLVLACALGSAAQAQASAPQFKVKAAGTLVVNGAVRIPAYVIAVADATADDGAFSTPEINASTLNVHGKVSADADRALVAYQTNVGWLLVPRGWRVAKAAVGADNSSVYEFDDPSGAGRIVSQDSGGACVGCAFSLASPYFPEARTQAKAMDLGANDSGKRVRAVRLGKHTMAYEQKGPGALVLDGIAWYASGDDYSAFTYEVSLPASQHALASTILNWRLSQQAER